MISLLPSILFGRFRNRLLLPRRPTAFHLHTLLLLFRGIAVFEIELNFKTRLISKMGITYSFIVGCYVIRRSVESFDF